MGKILVAVLGFSLLAAGAWFALQSSASKSLDPAASGATAPSAPKRQLDNVRGAAHRMESDADARAKDLEQKMKTDP